MKYRELTPEELEHTPDYNLEYEMYKDIRDSLTVFFELYGVKATVYITDKGYPEEIKNLYAREIDILGQDMHPDLMAVYKDQSGKLSLLVVEAKKNHLTIKDIAQGKMYGDIFKAKAVLMVAPYDLRKSIKDYYGFNKRIMTYNCDKTVYAIKLENKKLQIQNAFPVISGDLL